MPLKHIIYFILAAMHLVMVALFAGHFAKWGNIKNPVTQALAVVGNYTGSNNIFSFFAPAISHQPYAIYLTKDNNGNEVVLDLKGRSPEFANRVNNIYGYMALPEGGPAFSTSLAQAVFNRYPDVDTIRVAMVVQQIPDMVEYRRGERSRWRFWFHRDFARDSTTINNRK